MSFITARCVLIVFNVAFLTFGLGLLAIGLLSEYDPNFEQTWQNLKGNAVLNIDQINRIFIVLISVGGLTFSLGLIGCCGAFYKSRFLLCAYLAILIILLAAKIFLIYMTISFKGYFETNLNQVIINGIDDHYSGKDIGNVEYNAVNNLQSMYECCGSYGVDDYGSNPLFPSCYPNQNTTLTPYPYGCTTVILNVVNSNLPYIINTLFVVIVVELLAIMFSIYLCSEYQDEDDY